MANKENWYGKQFNTYGQDRLLLHGGVLEPLIK